MSETRNELYSLLIPLRGERLLVPRMCVAEVIAFADAERVHDGTALPDWFLGTIVWNGRRLPVVSFGRPGAGDDKKRTRNRIVVFHALTEQLKGGYYGVLTQGFPQLVRVNPGVLALDTTRPLPEDEPALCRVRMIHEYPLIPDVERLERMISELPIAA